MVKIDVKLKEPITEDIGDHEKFATELLDTITHDKMGAIVEDARKALEVISGGKMNNLKNSILIPVREYLYYRTGAIESSKHRVIDAFQHLGKFGNEDKKAVLQEIARRVVALVDDEITTKIGVSHAHH